MFDLFYIAVAVMFFTTAVQISPARLSTLLRPLKIASASVS
jgi:hypothetical protein